MITGIILKCAHWLLVGAGAGAVLTVAAGGCIAAYERQQARRQLQAAKRRDCMTRHPSYERSPYGGKRP